MTTATMTERQTGKCMLLHFSMRTILAIVLVWCSVLFSHGQLTPIEPIYEADDVEFYLARGGHYGAQRFYSYQPSATNTRDKIYITVPEDMSMTLCCFDLVYLYSGSLTGEYPLRIRLSQYDSDTDTYTLLRQLPFRVNAQNSRVFVYDETTGGSDSIGCMPLSLEAGEYLLEYRGFNYTDGEHPIKEDSGQTSQPRSGSGVYSYATISISVDEDSAEDFDYTGMDGHNSIHTLESKTGSATDGLHTTAYYDDFGRLVQTVAARHSPMQRDLVTLQEYDALGRAGRQWLPAVSMGTDRGDYVDVPTIKGQSVLNNSDAAPYAYPVYEDSPLNRVTGQYGTGSAWHANGPATTEYIVNSSLNTQLSLRRFSLSGTSGVAAMGNYASGTLHGTLTTDEDGRTVIEMKDREDRTVLVRSVNGTELLDTYYVYDALGRLCAVLPPAVSASAGSGTVSQTLLDNYAYLYTYDEKERMTGKKLPGAAWIYMAYDDADRLVYSQDGRLRAEGRAMFRLYDVYGRECLVGTCSKATVDGLSVSGYATVGYAGTAGDCMGYTLPAALNLTDVQVLTASYYDSYNFLQDLSLPIDTVMAVSRTDRCTTPYSLKTGGLTARRDGTATVYDAQTVYYDKRQRVICTLTANHLGGIDTENVSYNFTGQPTLRELTHTSAGHAGITENYIYNYDYALRPLKTFHCVNNGLTVTLHDYVYDGLGRMTKDKLNGHPSLQTTYTYNVRSWLKSVSNTLFSEQLYYESNPLSLMNIQYGGNISAMTWSAGSSQRGYSFTYDAVSRLTQADYYEQGVRSSHYDTRYTYDKMGNMLTLKRNGRQTGGSFGAVDDVTLHYTGNQLLKADDSAIAPTGFESYDFRDGASSATEYSYDANGNMTQDQNKGISQIQYDVLNMPRAVTWQNGNTVDYLYDGAGTKRAVTFHTGGQPATADIRRDYVGNLIYINDTLSQVLTDGGYVTMDGTTPVYHFYLRDHLGNNRVVAKADGTVKQVNHYYPFGMLMAESTGADIQRYKYNGKEFDAAGGLNWYDYGARQMDGIRFTSMDPLAWKYYDISPYAYCDNNPIKCIDPDGRRIYIPKKYQTKVLQMINTYSAIQYRVDLGGFMRVDKDAKINEKGSSHYSERLNATISSEGLLTIKVADKYTAKDGNFSKMYDVKKMGGGLTDKTVKTNVKTVISDEGYIVRDTNGNEVKKTAAEILIHEIVGHAAPTLAGTETGNAVKNENIVRKELSLQEREDEKDHNE